MTERAIKRERVREYLAARGLTGVLLTTTANFAWLTAGVANRAGPASEGEAASLLITDDTCVLIASEIEMPRLEAEGLADPEFTTETFPWHTADLAGIVRRRAGGGRRHPASRSAAGGRVAADSPVRDTEALGGDFAALRDSLLPEEVERYRRLGRETALCVTRACFGARPGLSENQIAGMLAGDLLAFGITPTALLVGADERARRFRHPNPTNRRLEAHLMICARAQRAGLTVSMTRLVHFGPPPETLRRAHDAVTRVDAALHAATRPGAAITTLFAAGEQAAAAWESAGSAPRSEAWRCFPQGGPTGYVPRDVFGARESEAIVLANQAFAWSPSLDGARSEDTLLASETGPEVVTATPDLPVVSVSVGGSVVPRPDILGR